FGERFQRIVVLLRGHRVAAQFHGVGVRGLALLAVGVAAQRIRRRLVGVAQGAGRGRVVGLHLQRVAERPGGVGVLLGGHGRLTLGHQLGEVFAAFGFFCLAFGLGFRCRLALLGVLQRRCGVLVAWHD